MDGYAFGVYKYALYGGIPMRDCIFMHDSGRGIEIKSDPIQRHKWDSYDILGEKIKN